MDTTYRLDGDEFALHSVDGRGFETFDEKMNALDASAAAETASNLGIANPGAAA